jgi:hypothetical protein
VSGEEKVPISGRHCVILRTLVALVLLLGTPAGATQPVDLALVLAVDVSRSVDDEEYRIQKDGYAEAFGSRAVIEAIESGAVGAIAVTYVEWSGKGRQRQLVPWTVIHNPATALAFADAIRASPRAFADFTAVGSAIDFAAGLFNGDWFGASRRVIDVSGDGVSNAGTPTEEARDRAVAAGITVNGLAILNEQWRLDAWYRDHVIGGLAAFVMPASDFADFRLAIMAKLVREIAARPMPRETVPGRFADRGQP